MSRIPGQVEHRARDDAQQQRQRGTQTAMVAEVSSDGSVTAATVSSPPSALVVAEEHQQDHPDVEEHRDDARQDRHEHDRPGARRQGDLKTAHLPTKPPVSGMPAIDSRKNPNAPATSGARRPSPAHFANDVASPPASRTRVTIAKAPTVAGPYVAR